MANPSARCSRCEKRARFAGQNNTNIGSSDSDDTALAVIACISPSMVVEITATPVANKPSVSRKAFGSNVAFKSDCPLRVRLSVRGGERLVPAFAHERAHAFRVLLNLGLVTRDQCTGHANRIAEEEALVEHLSRCESRHGGIPRQPKQRNSVERFRASCLVIPLDVLHERTLEIGFDRHGYQAGRPDLLNDLHHSRIDARKNIAGGVERGPRRADDATLVQSLT